MEALRADGSNPKVLFYLGIILDLQESSKTSAASPNFPYWQQLMLTTDKVSQPGNEHPCSAFNSCTPVSSVFSLMSFFCSRSQSRFLRCIYFCLLSLFPLRMVRQPSFVLHDLEALMNTGQLFCRMCINLELSDVF